MPFYTRFWTLPKRHLLQKEGIHILIERSYKALERLAISFGKHILEIGRCFFLFGAVLLVIGTLLLVIGSPLFFIEDRGIGFGRLTHRVGRRIFSIELYIHVIEDFGLAF